MKNIQDYLEKTESAVIKLFEGLDNYHKILLKSLPPMYFGNEGDTENNTQAYQEWNDRNRDRIQASSKKMQESFAERFAYTTLSGSLLQIADMAIQLFSENEIIPEDLPNELQKMKLPIKFCISRRIYNIPIGLIIYAGRNQYNHMDEKKLNKMNTKVFDLINQNHINPCFDLNNTQVINFSGNIIELLGWDHYEQYYFDMLNMLTTEKITYTRPTLDTFIYHLKNLLPNLKEKYEISLLGIFGSYVRKEETATSDLDLLVDFSPDSSIGLIKICELENYLTKQLRIQVDVTLLNELKSQASQHILSEVLYL